MDRIEAINFLKGKGYSRRISSKLVDIALLEKSDSVFQYALKHALELKKSSRQGHVAYTKKTKGGKVVQVQQKGVVREEQSGYKGKGGNVVEDTINFFAKEGYPIIVGGKEKYKGDVFYDNIYGKLKSVYGKKSVPSDVHRAVTEGLRAKGYWVHS